VADLVSARREAHKLNDTHADEEEHVDLNIQRHRGPCKVNHSCQTTQPRALWESQTYGNGDVKHGSIESTVEGLHSHHS